jgi:hypothetical protein
MNKSKAFNYTLRRTFLFSLTVSLGLSFPPYLSEALSVREPKTHYGSCAQLQKRLNDRNNPRATFKGFEGAKLMRRSYYGNAYLLYCNGGVIVDRVEKAVCRGYIGYGYDPEDGAGDYFGRWGWTDGSPNSADSGKERYCQQIK